MPDVPNNTCGALLPDGHTRCAIPLLFSTVSCATHAPAYDASYKRYKEAQRKADGLRKFARMPPVDIRRLGAHEIERYQVGVRAYVSALAKELRLRRRHDVQFVGTPDAGHIRRLEKLEREIAHHRQILQALRTRRWRLPQVDTHTLALRLHSPPRTVSRIASPVPRAARRRTGSKPEEERRARARAEALRQREEEQEQQHFVVIEAERKRQRQAVAEEAYNRHLETALFLSQVEKSEKEALRATGEGTLEVREGGTQGEWVEGAAMDTARDRNRLEECPPEEWLGEVAGDDVNAPGDDTASDSTSNTFSDDLQSPIQQLSEPLNVSIRVDDDWRLPSSTSASCTIDVDEVTESTGLVIENERVAGSEDSSVTISDSESAPRLEATWTDNQHEPQPAPEAVRLEVAIVLHAADDSCAQVPLAETPSRAASNQGFGDAVRVEDRKAGRSGQGGGNEGRPLDSGWGRMKRYLQCLAFAVIIALFVLRKRYRAKGLGKLWKLLKRVARAGTRRISN